MFGDFFGGIFEDRSVLKIPMPLRLGERFMPVEAHVQYQTRNTRVGWYGEVRFRGLKWKPTRVEEEMVGGMFGDRSLMLKVMPAEEDDDWTKTKTVKWFSRKSLDEVMSHLAVQVGMLREAGELRPIGKITASVVYTGQHFDEKEGS